MCKDINLVISTSIDYCKIQRLICSIMLELIFYFFEMTL